MATRAENGAETVRVRWSMLRGARTAVWAERVWAGDARLSRKDAHHVGGFRAMRSGFKEARFARFPRPQPRLSFVLVVKIYTIFYFFVLPLSDTKIYLS